MNVRRATLAALAALATLATGAAAAAEPVIEVDAELLEFLGSLDTEEADWHEYLADRPIRTEAGKPASPATGKPDARDQQTESSAKQQDKVKKP